MGKKKHKPQTRVEKPAFKNGDTVYITAFLRQDKKKFYLCRGSIEKCPEQNSRQIYKIKITAVGNKSIGGPEEFNQSALLGMSITKKFMELHKDIPFFMQPSKWIEIE